MDFSQRYRPKQPNQLIGQVQKDTAQMLKTKLEQGEIMRTLLFFGSSGVGKTTLARMYAQWVLGVDELKSYQFIEYNCSSDTGIDSIRENIIKRMQKPSILTKHVVYFLDELHGLSKSAQNALLVDIEPENLPDHVILIAATTEPKKIIPALKSRFHNITLDIPSSNEMTKLIGWICKSQKKELSQADIDLILMLSKGNIREVTKNTQLAIEGTLVEAKEQNIEKEAPILDFFYKPLNCATMDEFKKKVVQLGASYKDPATAYILLNNFAVKALSDPKYSTKKSLHKKAFAFLQTASGLNKLLPDNIALSVELLKLAEYWQDFN